MIDAWIQHPTARHSGDPMFDSLRRWTKSDLDAVPTVADTVAALDAAGISTALTSAWYGPNNVMISNDEVANFVAESEGRLVGVVSHRALLRLVAKGGISGAQKVSVREIMTADPITVAPDTRTVDAIRMMRERQLACLPVVENDKLVGLVTEHDLIVVSSHLLERYLAEER